MLNAKNQMKALYLTNGLAPRILISNTTSILNSEERILLPALRSCARNIQNAKKRSLTCTCLTEEEPPKWFRTTLRQEDFVKYNNGFENPNRIIMFSTNSNLEYLASSKYWICDGTFKMAPSLFYQLYVIIGEVVDVNVPLVYILLKNKTKDIYNLMFSVLKQKQEIEVFKRWSLILKIQLFLLLKRYFLPFQLTLSFSFWSDFLQIFIKIWTVYFL
jgi:hypothetical protein